MSAKKQIIVKTYKGNQQTASKAFQNDAAKMAAQGYVPTTQNWAPGAYGCGSFLFALLLCFVLIGFIVFIYMLLVKPEGTLSVTYELRQETVGSQASSSIDEKICPKCAETIKSAAVVCRYCGHTF